ncbi:hypothetical protein [Luteibacter sp. 22Crub2.1]|uniref:hypothetical protein n=1 Tax=Luteibacter sp. 22Crub2.1 TaxID=1283288 RepID=UPI0009A82642|nr:hypothetical protein [Luteibacter sp. 22Crub2.1]SKB57205.1 hypothetical protein SAMN05660880_01700 [Luteibacter sp. 22Crub2.1]
MVSASEVGFFLGIAPGVGYALWSHARAQQAFQAAQRTAQAHGEWLDLAATPTLRFHFVFRPQRFIRPNDGEGVRQAKAQLLAMRKPFLRRHALGALLAAVGAFVGMALALGLAPGA